MRQIPDFIKLMWRTPVWRINPSEKVIYLTFDDGPNPEVTPRVLDILDEFEAKATFFCVGENVMKYPEIFQEVKHRGHAVGNHTFNHVKGTEKTVKEYVDNVGKAHEYIHSKLFRPPHGRITLSQVNKLKADFKIIMWDFITYDFDRQVTSTEILKEVKLRSRNGSVVIFHDSLKARKNVLEALPEALRYWKKEGYEVKALHELTH
ncbi:MAG: polysaccharide deacetylase family protein [Paludibacteraceae bacterium]|nr:polysaccharide deacetylase family protein [Paludibacteraceae bacterium]